MGDETQEVILTPEQKKQTALEYLSNMQAMVFEQHKNIDATQPVPVMEMTRLHLLNLATKIGEVYTLAQNLSEKPAEVKEVEEVKAECCKEDGSCKKGECKTKKESA